MQLQIQTDTPASLVALQGPQPAQGIFWAFAIMVTIFGAMALYHRSWKLAMFPLSLAVFGFGLSVLPKTQPSYRVTLDYRSGHMQTQEIGNGKVTKEQDTSLADVASAEMQYNRDATRIAVLLRNGEQRFPLGQYHFTSEPQQYVVLTRIRAATGQVASAGR